MALLLGERGIMERRTIFNIYFMYFLFLDMLRGGGQVGVQGQGRGCGGENKRDVEVIAPQAQENFQK